MFCLWVNRRRGQKPLSELKSNYFSSEADIAAIQHLITSERKKHIYFEWQHTLGQIGFKINDWYFPLQEQIK